MLFSDNISSVSVTTEGLLVDSFQFRVRFLDDDHNDSSKQQQQDSGGGGIATSDNQRFTAMRCLYVENDVQGKD